MDEGVKSRPYDGSGRQARALQRRHRVLDVAWEHFRQHGYAATTVGALARDAGVSEETIYKAFGGKSGLVRQLRLRALRGAGDQAAEDRSDRLREEPDPRRIVRGWARLAAEVAPRVTPVLLLVRDAAIIDPGLRGLATEVEEERRRRMQENASALHRAGHLRPGVTVRHAADVMYAVSSPELFELLVMRCGWSLDRYSRHIEATLAAALLLERHDGRPA